MLAEAARYLPELRTERLLLRALRDSDAEDVFAYAKQPEVARHTLWDPHRSIQDSYAFLDFVQVQHRSGQAFIWGMVHAGETRVIGTIGLANFVPQHSRAEIGFAIASRYWGQGYTTEAVRAVLRFSFRDLQLNRIEAYCKVENVASARVLEKTGLRFEGVLREREFIKGRFENLKLYAMLRGEYLKA
jgi:[ribosomal protein S5]-alanine N-acetyltransferase